MKVALLHYYSQRRRQRGLLPEHSSFRNISCQREGGNLDFAMNGWMNGVDDCRLLATRGGDQSACLARTLCRALTNG